MLRAGAATVTTPGCSSGYTRATSFTLLAGSLLPFFNYTSASFWRQALACGKEKDKFVFTRIPNPPAREKVFEVERILPSMKDFVFPSTRRTSISCPYLDHGSDPSEADRQRAMG